MPNNKDNGYVQWRTDLSIVEPRQAPPLMF